MTTHDMKYIPIREAAQSIAFAAHAANWLGREHHAFWAHEEEIQADFKRLASLLGYYITTADEREERTTHLRRLRAIAETIGHSESFTAADIVAVCNEALGESEPRKERA